MISEQLNYIKINLVKRGTKRSIRTSFYAISIYCFPLYSLWNPNMSQESVRKYCARN